MVFHGLKVTMASSSSVTLFGFSSHTTSRSLPVYGPVWAKHQSLTCATLSRCDRKVEKYLAALNLSSIRGPWTQVCFLRRSCNQGRLQLFDPLRCKFTVWSGYLNSVVYLLFMFTCIYPICLMLHSTPQCGPMDLCKDFQRIGHCSSFPPLQCWGICCIIKKNPNDIGIRVCLCFCGTFLCDLSN